MTKRQTDLLDTLAGIIPGYTGYAERDDRRTQDKRLRQHVGDQLDRSKRSLDGLVGLVLERGQLEGLDDIDRLKQLVGTCADTVRLAPEGASGLRDSVQVKTADLDRVYQHDLGLNTAAEELGVKIAALTSDTFKPALADLRKSAQELQKAIAQRDELLREVFH